MPIVESVTKYAVFLDRPEKIRYYLEKAYTMAIHGRPGPVFIDIPIDFQGAMVDEDELERFDEKLEDFFCDNAEIDNVLSKIQASNRPVILAGNGIRVANYVEKFNHLVEKLNIPVLTTGFGVDAIAWDHALFVGHPGVKGDRAGNLAVQNADLLIILGSSLHVTTTGYEIDKFAPNAHKILIDLDDGTYIKQEVKIDIRLRTSIQYFINYVLESDFIYSYNKKWNQYCATVKHELNVMKEPHKHIKAQNGTSINIYDFFDKISLLSSDNDILITDAGSTFYVMGQAYRNKHGQRIINSGGLGAMGFALPGAIGAASADKAKTVICITGDGSLQTNIQELASVRHYGFNIKIFIINKWWVCIYTKYSKQLF